MVTSAAPIAPDAPAPHSPTPDTETAWVPSHYQQVVLSVCERRTVVTTKTVFSSTDIKLVEGGVQIRPDFYRRLAQHALRTPLEELLTVVDDPLSIASLVDLAREQCLQDPLLQALVDGDNAVTTAALVAPLQTMSLPPSLAFMLSVMREQYPEQLAHAMHVALVAVYLGLRSGLSKGECANLAAAGLLHDVGTLHIDPVWLDGSRPITGSEREELARHPIIAAQLVNASGVYPRSVSVAILEHHERMDGSGYPRGTSGRQISPMGQILLLAEVIAAFFEKYAKDGAAVRLSLTLRLGYHKFPVELVALVLPLLQQTNIQTGDADDLQQVQALSACIAKTLAHWSELQAQNGLASSQDHAGEPWAFVTQRLHALQRSLFDAGCHPEQQGELLPLLQDDTHGLKEMLFLVREALWQLRSIAHTTATRWPQIRESQATGDVAVRTWRDALLAMAPA